jgi:hypothetical protein
MLTLIVNWLKMWRWFWGCQMCFLGPFRAFSEPGQRLTQVRSFLWPLSPASPAIVCAPPPLLFFLRMFCLCLLRNFVNQDIGGLNFLVENSSKMYVTIGFTCNVIKWKVRFSLIKTLFVAMYVIFACSFEWSLRFEIVLFQIRETIEVGKK